MHNDKSFICFMALVADNLSIKAVMADGIKPVVRKLSFEVREGEPLAIVGESGCGKTMTALAMFGLLPDNCTGEGSVKLNGEELIGLSERRINRLRGDSIVYVPQNGADFLNPSLKIITQMGESLRKNGIKNRLVRKYAAANLLQNVGIDDAMNVLNKYPFQISGGQAQRVALAISMCGNPRLVIADEPTKGIDDKTADLFLDKLDEVFSRACIIIITHNIAVARRCAYTLVMKDGVLQEYGKTSDVLDNPQADYTKKLLAALPVSHKTRKEETDA